MIIVAKNDAFSQMLKIELEKLGIDANICDDFEKNNRFAVVDLDFMPTIPDGIVALTYSCGDIAGDLCRPFLTRDFKALAKARFTDAQGAEQSLIINGNGVWFGESEIELSKKEKELLMLLFENRNTPVFESEIRERVFAGSVGNVCPVYIGYLRRKIDQKYSKKYIYTVRGGAYMLKI